MVLQYIQKYVDDMIAEVPGVISVNIINYATGKSLAYKSHGDEIYHEEVGVYIAETANYAVNGLEHVANLEEHEIDNLSITLDEQVHLIYSSKRKRLLSHIIVRADEVNIAMTELLHKKHYSTLFNQLEKEMTFEEMMKHPLLGETQKEIKPKSPGFFLLLFSS